MTGETDLQKLLAHMRPSLSEAMFGFATVASRADLPAGLTVLGTFVEDEGLSIIGLHEELASSGLGPSGPWARITLTVHSSLAAVGLTASVAAALADRGLSANVVAAYFHDHVFVPWDERRTAMSVLNGIAAAPPSPPFRRAT